MTLGQLLLASFTAASPRAGDRAIDELVAEFSTFVTASPLCHTVAQDVRAMILTMRSIGTTFYHNAELSSGLLFM